jgi:predicted PurR-regulated permease PerM
MSLQGPDTPLPEEGAARPSIMPRALTLLLGMAAVVVTAQAIQPIRSTIAAAFMALNIVIVVWPIQRRLAKYVPRFLASIVAGIAAIAILVTMIASLGWTIGRLIQELPNYSSQFYALVNRVNDFATKYNIDANAVMKQALQQLRDNINPSTIISTLSGIASSLSGFLGLLFMIVMILIFMIVDSVGFSERMQRLGERHNPTLAWALGSFAVGTRKYWVVTTIFGLIVAGCNLILLLVLGVPLATIWAIFSFVTNYIPNIGFIIGIVPPAVMALLANDPLTALWVIIGYIVFNTVIQTFIQPKFTGDAVGITPTVAILSLLLWAYILGPLGAILAIPATLLMKTLFIDIDPHTRWLNAFIASNPTTSDQDPMRLSDLLNRAKRIRQLTEKVSKPGVTPAEAEAAHRELAELTYEEDDD